MILCMVFFVAACAQPKGERETLFQDTRSETLQRTVQVQVTLGQEKLELGKSPEEQLWERAEMKGVRKAVNPWINKGYLIRPSGANVLEEAFSDFHVRKGTFDVQPKEITQVYSKRFDVRVTLNPVEQVSGMVTAIEAKRSMAAGNFQVMLQLTRLVPDEQGAYFVIVQKGTALQDPEQGQLVGSGHIYRTLGNKAQATLMESKREIQKGDLVFLLRTEITPVATEKEEEPDEVQKEPKQPEQPEVMVEPKKEEQGPKLPKEPK
jgi:hypothetical protein